MGTTCNSRGGQTDAPQLSAGGFTETQAVFAAPNNSTHQQELLQVPRTCCCCGFFTRLVLLGSAARAVEDNSPIASSDKMEGGRMLALLATTDELSGYTGAPVEEDD